MSLTNGIYSICSLNDYTRLADNSNASKSANNPQILFSYNGSYAQKFKISDGESGKTDEKKITNQDSGQSWYINKAVSLSNQAICQFPDSSGASADERSWLLAETGGTATINGNTYNAQHLKCSYNNSYCISYKNAWSASTNPISLAIFDTNDTYQKWLFLKTTFYQPDWQAPGFQVQGENNGRVNVARDTVEEKFIAFVNGGSQQQVRVKREVLLHNTNNWVSDDLYYSPTGETTDLGFGNVWSNNATGSINYGMESANSNPGSSAVYSQPYDSVRYTFEARQYQSLNGNPWSGVTGVKQIYTAQKTQGSLNGARMTAQGLAIDYSTTAFRTCDTATLTLDVLKNGKSVLVSPEKVQTDYTQNVYVIDWTNFKKMVQFGDTITVSFNMRTNSQYLTDIILKETLTVTIEGGELDPVITFTDAGNYNIKVNITEKTGQTFNTVRLSMIYEHDGDYVIQKLVEEGNVTEAIFACPLNKEFYVFGYLANEVSGSIDKWGTAIGYHTRKCNVLAVINSISEEVAFTMTTGSNPSDIFEKKKELSNNEVTLNGTKYTDVFFNRAQPTTSTLSNLFMPYENRKNINKVLNDCYCLVRIYNGEYFYAAVKDVSYGTTFKQGEDIQINLTEINHEVDIEIPS